MSSVNKVILIGNLGRDPELSHTKSGQPVCKLSLATSRKWKNKQSHEMQEETEWHRVTVWGKSAEHCNSYLAKGRSCYVEGRLKTSTYEKNGEKRYSTEIVADVVQFLGGKEAQTQRTGGGGSFEPGNPSFDTPANSNYKSDDDLPF